MTQWARSVDQNSRAGGSGIIVMSAEEAMLWAERHLGADTVEEHFSDLIEEG
jgi:hypothetical protein